MNSLLPKTKTGKVLFVLSFVAGFIVGCARVPTERFVDPTAGLITGEPLPIAKTMFIDFQNLGATQRVVTLEVNGRKVVDMRRMRTDATLGVAERIRVATKARYMFLRVLIGDSEAHAILDCRGITSVTINMAGDNGTILIGVSTGTYVYD